MTMYKNESTLLTPDGSIKLISSLYCQEGMKESCCATTAIENGIVQNIDWTGLDWTGLDWTGLDGWTGLDSWTGLDWTGLDWTDFNIYF